MLVWLILGVVVAAFVAFLLRNFVKADPKSLARLLRGAGIAAALILALALLATGRLVPALEAVGAALLFFVRWNVLLSQIFGEGWWSGRKPRGDDASAREQGEQPSGERRSGSAMTVEEARHILGVGAGAAEDEIKDAHRRLMMKNHPDQGGSTYLASKINQAKDVLLKKRR
jgi:hypothetical protein